MCVHLAAAMATRAIETEEKYAPATSIAPPSTSRFEIAASGWHGRSTNSFPGHGSARQRPTARAECSLSTPVRVAVRDPLDPLGHDALMTRCRLAVSPHRAIQPASTELGT